MKQKALFITESMTDLRCHLDLAMRLRDKLGIVFLVKAESLRRELWKKGFPSFAYTELLSDDVAHRVEEWWQENRTKPFELLTYNGFTLWKLMEFERQLILSDSFNSDLRSAVGLWASALPSELIEGNDGSPEQVTAALICRTVGLIETFSRLMRFVQPSAAFVWNGLFLPTRACAEICSRHGVPTFFSEEGYFPNTMVVDPVGVNASSILGTPAWEKIAKREPEEQEVDRLKHFIRRYHASGESRVKQSGEALKPGEVCARLHIGDNEKIVLYPAQIDTDTNIILSSPVYPTNEMVIADLAKAAEAVPGARIVVKLHPRDKDREREFAAVLGDRGCIVNDIQLQSLLATAHVVAVRNSTVGIEALTYRLPVVTLGQSIYSGKGFTFDVEKREELADKLNLAISTGGLPEGSRSALDRFLIHMTQRYLYQLDEGDKTNSTNEAIESELLASIDGSIGSKREEILPIGQTRLMDLLKEQGPLLHRGRLRSPRLERVARKAAKWAPLQIAPEEIKELCRIPRDVGLAFGR